ncbi:MAG: D-alanyl-D-alanine carboxypeptidase [Ruminococcaceae bacterium]|nr:D-alanyl-D-alanine carboxypeptidase [Oscillospiraceae bacterium]
MSTRRLTPYQRRRARKAKQICIIGAALLLILALAWLVYRLVSSPDRPPADLHGKDDPGYIPVSGELLDLDLDARQAFVYDCNRGEIVYLKGEAEVVYPASTTKLLTVLCALEVLSPEEIITPGEELSLVEPGSSLAYVKDNHRLSVQMLVEGMLLPSGNDAAYVLAAAAGNRMSDGEATGREAVAVFMDHMNEYAKTLGLKGSHFTVPDGLAGNEHYSTLEDMLLVARAAAQHPLISRYAAMAKDSVTYESGHTNTWVNTNAMLDPTSPYYRPSVTGLKTGSLDRNFCVIVTAEAGGERYIIGIFGARDKNARFADAARAVDALFSNGEVAP